MKENKLATNENLQGPELVFTSLPYEVSQYNRARLEVMFSENREVHLFLEGKKFSIYKIRRPMSVSECKQFLEQHRAIPVDGKKMNTILSEDSTLIKAIEGKEYENGSKDISFIGLDESSQIFSFVFKMRTIPDLNFTVDKEKTFQPADLLQPDPKSGLNIFSLTEE